MHLRRLSLNINSILAFVYFALAKMNCPQFLRVYRRSIMDNLVLYKGVYISKEQYDDIKNMRQLSDEEIKRFRANIRHRKNLQQAS